MRQIALTRASELIDVTDTLDHLGYSAERMLEKAQLPMWQYCNPDDLVPKLHIFELMDRAARTLGSPTFGLLVGEHTRLSAMGSFGSLVASSLTTYHVIATCCRLISLHNAGSHLSLVEAGDEVWFCHKEFPIPEDGRWHKELFTLMRGIDAVRMGAGPSWQPIKVSLQTREVPGRELREALGDPEIRIGRKSTAFAVPRALLARPLRRSSVALNEASDVVEKRLWQTAPGSSFVDALRLLVGTLLKQEGAPRIETMAEVTGLSVRSLQRRLAQHGLSHSQIIEQARYEAATRLLENADNRITDIGMELGYADSAHFTRAFKRWAGVSPREYRNQQVMH